MIDYQFSATYSDGTVYEFKLYKAKVEGLSSSAVWLLALRRASELTPRFTKLLKLEWMYD